MKSKFNFLAILGIFILFIALAPTVEASVSANAFFDGQSSSSLTITQGQNILVESSATAVGEKLKTEKLTMTGPGTNWLIWQENEEGWHDPTGQIPVYHFTKTTNLNSGQFQAGTYQIKFTAEGQQSSPVSDTLTLKIVLPDQNAPNVDISYPIDGTLHTSQINSMEYTPTDAEGNLDQCWYSTDGGQTNSSKVNCNDGVLNTFSGLNSNQGLNTWTVYASDTNGNIGKDEVTFYLQNKVTPSNNGGSDGEPGYTPGQGGYYSHEKDEYLDQFDHPDQNIIQIIEEDDKELNWWQKFVNWLARIFGFNEPYTL